MNVKASMLGSMLNVDRPERYSGNPIGWQVPEHTRESLPMYSMSPRMRHPALNASPWSTSYQVSRVQKHPKSKIPGVGRTGYST